MLSSGILRRVVLVRTDVSEGRSSSIIRATIIDVLGTRLTVTSNRCTLRRNTKWAYVAFLRSVRWLLVTSNVPSWPIHFTRMMEALSSFETSALTRTTRRNISEDGILHSHLRENLKFYMYQLCYLNNKYLYRTHNVSTILGMCNIIALSRKRSKLHKRACTYTISCLQWPTLRPPRIMPLLPGTLVYLRRYVLEECTVKERWGFEPHFPKVPARDSCTHLHLM
jgi:hypothetical protein